LKTEILPASAENIKVACTLLQEGGVVGLPTETVYGLAGNAFSSEAVKKIFSAKDRPSFDPLIVHLKKEYLTDARGVLKALVEDEILSAEILTWAHASEIEAGLKQFWPGPLTAILPKGSKIPNEVTSGQSTVGIRIPAHPVFQTVLSSLDFPLAAPSANRFGRISPTEAKHVKTELDGKIAVILEGEKCTVGVESTIVRVNDSPYHLTLLRPGKIGVHELEPAFKTTAQVGKTLGETLAAPVTPGMLDEHYAPRKPLFLFPHSFRFNSDKIVSVVSALPIQEHIKDPKNSRGAVVSVSVLDDSIRLKLDQAIGCHFSQFRTLSSKSDLTEMAQKLFSTLREMDESKDVDFILIDLPVTTGNDPKQEGLSLAIADRLRRASRNKPIL
jgi:L-threonylcarbamoyladenylate synthase